MSSISAWALSIVGICLLSVVIDLMLPSGKTNSNIKKVVSYAIILVVLLPIPNILNGNIRAEGIFDNSIIELQDNYIYNLNQSKLDSIKNKIENELNSMGILGVSVSISANIFEDDMEIYAIYVDLYNLVITEDASNINIKKIVKDLILGCISIKEEKIIFYE
ncbi:MAG: hypothetical protein J6T74_08385 [Clostridia bacterium]|nr:hypothetical protein [Clostridia bacterium]